MSNIATAFKAEITRIARKEAKTMVEPLRKQVASQRAKIASLKSALTELERQLRTASKSARSNAPEQSSDDAASKARITGPGIKSLRTRLGLSQEDFARLSGLSAQSIYNYERNGVRPRQAQATALIALRSIGKREARDRINALKTSATRKASSKRSSRPKS